jgi:hypothetical protein
LAREAVEFSAAGVPEEYLSGVSGRGGGEEPGEYRPVLGGMRAEHPQHLCDSGADVLMVHAELPRGPRGGTGLGWLVVDSSR